MKILVHEWNHYMVESVNDTLNNAGIIFDKFTKKFEQDRIDEEFLAWFDANVEKNKYDFVLSVNYFPTLAIACNKKKIRYVAWCCDCPFNITNPEETLGFDTNYCFVFDYHQYVGFKSQGIDTVYHLPLGANSYKARTIKYDSAMAEKYRSDVALVGVLYESQLPIIMSLLDEPTKDIINELVKSQEQLYNYNIFRECISDDLINYMNAQYADKLKEKDGSFSVNKKALEFALSCEATRRNRIMLLNLMGKRYDTRLYSYQNFEVLQGVKQCGTVDYNTEMPYVFRYSKINLNPSLRCIETGVPLRAFDIMGFGGFLLSNYQQELADMFTDGKEIVLYDSYEDALDKADFYLKHEDKRENIAKCGQERTLNEYTLQKAFNSILKVLEN